MTAWTAGHSAALLEQRVIGVNFHDIAAETRAEVSAQLRLAAQLGESWHPDTDRGAAAVPQVFVAFYDGYHDTGMFGAELCADLGLRAFFFPIFASADPARATLTDEDLTQIAIAHEIGFHSTSHAAVEQVTPETLTREVLDPVERIQTVTGRRPWIGAWRGGTRFDGEMLGDRTLRDLGLTHLVSNWSIERIPGAT